MHFRLFNKPAAFGLANPPGAMWIDGVYEDYVAGEPYEGRVQIHGSKGLMKVEILDSNLPPGASVYIDQITKEVVVKWLKYEPPVNTIKGVPNGSFETQEFWELVGPGTPCSIEQGWSPDGKGNLTYRDQKGQYKVYGAWAPVSSRTRQILLTAKVEHGKSSKGNASCAIALAWYDEKRQLVREDVGNAVTNGGKGRWYDTKVFQSSGDPAIRFVRPCVIFDRRKQNHPIHAGQVEWDHAYEQGYLEDETKFVEVKVTDSLHNVAIHRGIIEENNIWLTSTLYPTLVVEQFGSKLGYIQARTGKAHNGGYDDGFTTSIGISRVVFKSNVIDTPMTDVLSPKIGINKIVLRKAVVEVKYPYDSLSPKVGLNRVRLWRNAINTAYRPDTLSPKIGINNVKVTRNA